MDHVHCQQTAALCYKTQQLADTLAYCGRSPVQLFTRFLKIFVQLGVLYSNGRHPECLAVELRPAVENDGRISTDYLISNVTAADKCLHGAGGSVQQPLDPSVHSLFVGCFKAAAARFLHGCRLGKLLRERCARLKELVHCVAHFTAHLHIHFAAIGSLYVCMLLDACIRH